MRGWISLKSSLVIRKKLVVTVERVQGSLPWFWMVQLKGDRLYLLTTGHSRNESNAKRAALKSAELELRILDAKRKVLDQVEGDLGPGNALR